MQSTAYGMLRWDFQQGLMLMVYVQAWHLMLSVDKSTSVGIHVPLFAERSQITAGVPVK